EHGKRAESPGQVDGASLPPGRDDFEAESSRLGELAAWNACANQELVPTRWKGGVLHGSAARRLPVRIESFELDLVGHLASCRQRNAEVADVQGLGSTAGQLS